MLERFILLAYPRTGSSLIALALKARASKVAAAS
jgi:hypothetical protein